MRRAAAFLTFSKLPVRGRVKTRMEPLLGKEGALELHRALLADAVDRQERLKDVAEPMVYLSDPGPVAATCQVRLQRGQDLGERMGAAFGECFAEGYTRVVIAGIDSPTLPDELVRQAFDRLGKSDVVVGPCDDGGYYLIGLRRPIPALFAGVAWGTDQVLEQTRERIRRNGLRSVELPTWFDLDLPDDLGRIVPASSVEGRHTRAFVLGVGRR